MDLPKLACCNFFADNRRLREFALEQGFDGVDWSFSLDNRPSCPAEEDALAAAVTGLYPLEVRFHSAMNRVELGHADEAKAAEALRVQQELVALTARLGGRYLTVHLGLGRETTHNLSWERTVENLGRLRRFADDQGVGLCLENLAWGWTSRPNLFEKLVRLAGTWVTLDIGHARVSPSVESSLYDLSDFVAPHPDRVVNAHIYHEEREDAHVAPSSLDDLETRLLMLDRLPACDWWVLEIREEQALARTLEVVRDYLRKKHNGRVRRYDSPGG